MRVKVKYTLPFRDDVGVKEETYEIDRKVIAVADMLDLIVRRHSSVAEFLETTNEEAQRHHLVVAINSRLARLSDGVHDGDTVSILLPVVGGSTI